MKKILLFVILSLVTVFLNAQSPFPSKNEIKQFGASVTCVVLEDDPFSFFNSYIKEAMEEFWKVTSYEFIEESEFNVRRTKTGYSFIVLTETN